MAHTSPDLDGGQSNGSSSSSKSTVVLVLPLLPESVASAVAGSIAAAGVVVVAVVVGVDLGPVDLIVAVYPLKTQPTIFQLQPLTSEIS